MAVQIAGGVGDLADDSASIGALSSPIACPVGPLFLDQDISRLVGRANVVCWGASRPVAGGQSYLLDSSQAHRKSSADGVSKTREDVDGIEFREIDDGFWAPARAFLERKDEYAACACRGLESIPSGLAWASSTSASRWSATRESSSPPWTFPSHGNVLPILDGLLTRV